MKKNKIAMNEAEWRTTLHALNDLRNKLIAEGSYTDIVDSVIISWNVSRILSLKSTARS